MIEYVSASQITTFRDCARKWYFNKIVGLSTPSTPATELGSAVHEALEAYLRDGADLPANEAGEIARSGVHLLPTERRVEIELSLAEQMPLTDSPVRVVGYVDALYPTTHHILDHKTSSNKRYTKTQRELAENVQLILYARAYIERAQDAEEITLTHVYYGTKSRWSKRVDVKLSRQEIIDKWGPIRADIERMMSVSEAPNAEEVSPNRDACDKYGGCPFASQCFRARNYAPKGATVPPTKNEKRATEMTPEERMKQLGLTPPKQRAESAPPQAPAQAPASQKILYIGCIPLKGSERPSNALDAYAEPVASLCNSFKVPHLSLVDFGKGWSALSGAVAEMGWPSNHSALYLDPISKEYEFLVTVLSSLADIVIKRA